MRTFMAQNRAGSAWQQADGAREIGVADSESLDLDEDLFWLNFVKLNLLKLELAVEFGDDKGGGCAWCGHLCCLLWCFGYLFVSVVDVEKKKLYR